MSQDIYQQGIKDLAAAKQGAGMLDNADVAVTLDNSLCGDRISLTLKLKDGRIVALGHNVRGCLLCHASASVIGSAAEDWSWKDLEAVHAKLTAMLKGQLVSDWPPQWQSLSLFKPVQAHKSRHSCVLLPFKALIAALNQLIPSS